jgi:hypothetical protein
MQRITNVSLTDRARELLRRRLAKFRPRAPDRDLFALVYTSTFTNRDGTTVEGFVPGYAPVPWPAENAGPDCVAAHPIDGPDFIIVPPFKWRADDHYVVDVASDVFPTLSIDVVSGADVR